MALGGGGFPDGVRTPVDDFVLSLARSERPRICFVPTASAEDTDYTLRFYRAFGDVARPSHATFFPWPEPRDLRAHLLAQDVVFVGGGNTANMLAIWRVHGFDAALREAWEAGVVLAGVSAGMLCWFEAGVTDSFGPELAGLRDGLGFLPGSACPHYDGEERRRPVYTGLVRDGFPPGYAAEDGVALHFAGTELADVVTSREEAFGYRVEPEGELPLPARRL